MNMSASFIIGSAAERHQQMMASLKQFADELRAHQSPAEADLFVALVGGHSQRFLEALERIVSRTEPLVERLDQICRLVEIEMLDRSNADNIQPPTIN